MNRMDSLPAFAGTKGRGNDECLRGSQSPKFAVGTTKDLYAAAAREELEPVVMAGKLAHPLLSRSPALLAAFHHAPG